MLNQAYTAIRLICEFHWYSGGVEPGWEGRARAVKALNPRWDAKAQAFVAAPRSE